MRYKSKITRRNFLRNSALLGGSFMVANNLSASISSFFTSPENKEHLAAADDLLKGVSDIHVHAAPDSKARLIDELSFARDAKAAGYNAIMYKSNDFSCHDRAYLIQQELPGFRVFGSICMNKIHGDKVNVIAAEKAVNTTGKLCRCIWMPTQDAVYQYRMHKVSGQGIAVLSNSGSVLPEVVRVMEICAEADIIFATGHSSPEESIVLARKAKEIGVKKFVVTHANSGIWTLTHNQIKQCIDLGAFIEYSYITNLWGPGTGLPDFEKMSDEQFTAFARINPERSFITTDLGQVGMTHPLEGMKTCILGLLRNGMQQKDIDILVRNNPAKLVGL